MKRSLKALTRSLIDYAGMFPPASLSLEQSLDNYLTFRKEKDNWLLGRFICPAGRLEQAVASLEVRKAENVEVSILLQGPSLHELLPEIQRVQILSRGSLIRVGAFECRLEDRPALSDEELSRYLNRVAGKMGDLGFDCPLFCEASLAGRQRWPLLWETARELNQRIGAHSQVSLGFKLRCGGPDASFIPSLEQVAQALVETRESGLRIKATAGLHHAMRHFDIALRTPVHGFLNLFGAGVLSDTHQLDKDETLKILAEEDFEAFGIEDDGLRWGPWKAGLSQIEAARERLISFGSCSFDEPLQELKKVSKLEISNNIQ